MKLHEATKSFYCSSLFTVTRCQRTHCHCTSLYTLRTFQPPQRDSAEMAWKTSAFCGFCVRDSRCETHFATRPQELRERRVRQGGMPTSTRKVRIHVINIFHSTITYTYTCSYILYLYTYVCMLHLIYLCHICVQYHILYAWRT